MDHSFNVQVAKHYGVNEAIMLNNLYFWVEKNRANKKNFHDGRYWTYNSQEAFTELFPYWSRHKIQRILSSLEQSGLILKGNYNKNNYDRTTWYSLTDQALNIYQQPIVQNCTMDRGDSHNGSCETAQPIPDSKPNSKQDSTDSPAAKNGNVPYSEIVSLYNNTCSTTQVKKISANRRKHIGARWKQYDCSLDAFKELFTNTANSDFLNGTNKRNWSADFDWLMNEDNMAKVLEGKYENKDTPQQSMALSDLPFND